MRKPVKVAKSKNPKVYPVAYVNPRVLQPADYNPRNIKDLELNRLAHNIAIYGFLVSVTACKEDNELVGGHQRVKAALMLLDGVYVPMDDEGNEIPFDMPKTIPCVYVEGLSVQQRKRLNLSLNRISGEWDYDGVVKIVGELYEDALSHVEGIADDVDRDLKAMESMLDTGFTAAEMTDYLDIFEKPSGDGKGPTATTGTPKITLEFTSKKLRDAFKAYVAAHAMDGMPSGDSIATKLGIAGNQD